jgi:hypothetical protein
VLVSYFLVDKYRELGSRQLLRDLVPAAQFEKISGCSPERPLQLAFGGPDRKTFFILAHHALFAAQLR